MNASSASIIIMKRFFRAKTNHEYPKRTGFFLTRDDLLSTGASTGAGRLGGNPRRIRGAAADAAGNLRCGLGFLAGGFF